MLDMTPGEQLPHCATARSTGAHSQGADLLARDFYTRKLAVVPSLVVLPVNHSLASHKQIAISQFQEGVVRLVLPTPMSRATIERLLDSAASSANFDPASFRLPALQPGRRHRLGGE